MRAMVALRAPLEEPNFDGETAMHLVMGGGGGWRGVEGGGTGDGGEREGGGAE